MDQPPAQPPLTPDGPMSAEMMQPPPWAGAAPMAPAPLPPMAPMQPMQPMPIPPDAAIATVGLTRVFGKKVAVNGLNLAVRRGEFFGFLGPNGAGKSTTIKMLVGLLRPSSGVAYVGGVDVWRDPLAVKRLIGVLPETLNLYERLTGRELVEFAGRLYDLPKAEVRRRAASLLDVLALGDDADKMIVDYSVGMRKKVALAAALVHRPQVLFLDEPFEGVDPVSSRVIRDILRDLTTTGTTIFFSSHIMEVVERLCTRVGIISNGLLVAEGTLAELRARAGGADATLEDLFLQLIGANTREGGLEWLES